jgi:hypothetical protein
MPEPRGTFAIAYQEPRGPRKRLRFTRIERADADAWWQTTEEWTGCGWQIQSRERVNEVSLEADIDAVTTRAGP